MTAALIPLGANNRENLHHVPMNPARHPETGGGDGGGRTGRACRPALRSSHSPHRLNQARIPTPWKNPPKRRMSLPNHVRNPRTKQPCNTGRIACQAAHAWSRLTRSFRAGFDSLRGSRREVGTNLARSCSGDVNILTTTRFRVRIPGSGDRAAPARRLVGANSLPRHPTSTDQDRFDGQQRRRQGKR